MKRLAIFICVLFLLCDMADDLCPGKAKFNYPKPLKKITFTSPSHPDSNQTDFQEENEPTDLSENRPYGETEPVILVRLTIRIIQCCISSSSGGIPL